MAFGKAISENYFDSQLHRSKLQIKLICK